MKSLNDMQLEFQNFVNGTDWNKLKNKKDANTLQTILFLQILKEISEVNNKIDLIETPDLLNIENELKKINSNVEFFMKNLFGIENKK